MPGGQRAVVDHMAVHDGRVRDHDLLVLRRAQVRDLEPHLGHVTEHVADHDPVPNPVGAPVRQRVAGDDVRNRR